MKRLAAALLSFALAFPAHASILDVSPDGSGPYPDIQTALIAAQSGDSIRLADGVFTGVGNRNLIIDGANLTLFSASADAESCIIDCEDDGRAFLIRTFPGVAVRIEGLSLRGGDPRFLPSEWLTGYGGAIAAEGIIPGGGFSVANCIIEQNIAEAGGGVFLWDTEAEFQGCIFRGNRATDGGGVYCGYCRLGEGVRFELCIFYGNSYPYQEVGGYGAGVYYSHSIGGLSSCTLTDNTAWLGAGLLVSTDSNVDVTRSLLAFNYQGEGLAVNAGEVSIDNCDIYGNVGGDWIGAIADRLGVDCNIGADPIFCYPLGANYTLRSDSPCLPENNGGCYLIGALPLGCQIPTGVVISPQPKPELGLHCFPNPANPRTTIQFDLAAAAQIKLTLHDLRGRRLALVFEGPAQSGKKEFSFDARDDRGRALPSGIYLLSLETTGERRITRFALIR